jgi:hypothetical protein
MTRQFVLNGETIAEVRGGVHMSGAAIGVMSELGLSVGQVTIEPQINFKSVYVNDFGPDVPPDVLTMLSSVKISMTLIHYDPEVLDICIGESMGNSIPNLVENSDAEGGFVQYVGGTLAGAGTPLGGLKRIFDSGWHYISLNLSSQVLGQPWTFPKCYLNRQPVKIPIGTELSQVYMEWTALPYFDPYMSGNGGFGPATAGVLPYPTQISGGPTTTYSLRGDIPSSGAILWTRVRDLDFQIIPMND